MIQFTFLLVLDILLHEEGKTLQMPHKTRFKEKSCLKCDTY